MDRPEKYDLKTLSRDGVEGALAKVERYRLLNEPWEAESICRDVLATDPDNQRAIVMLILSLTDQFDSRGGAGFDEARQLVAELQTEYERAYYHGLICERRAKVHFERAHPGAANVAFEWYEQAMTLFEQAERVRPAGNEEAALRWNTCARMLMRHPQIRPAPRDDLHPMLE